MIVQAITSFSLTQLLSKAGQRLIAEMRRQVQRHVGLLSVAYYDENRTGTLVARIMATWKACVTWSAPDWWSLSAAC